MSYFNDIQFLDLNDVSKEEVEEIHSILYSARTPSSVVLPWIEEQVDWNQQSSYGMITYYPADWLYLQHPEGETSECSETGAECYQTGGPPHVPCPPTSLHQVYSPHGQVVSAVPLSYIPTAGYFSHHQQPQVYDEGRRRSKASPKRNSGSGTSSSPAPPAQGGVQPPGGGSPVAPPNPYHPPLGPYPYHPALVPAPPPPQAQYQYMSGVPAAQHATGHPLFLSPQMPIYTAAPPHLYSQYPPHQQVYNPALHGGHPPGQQTQERTPKSDESNQVSVGQQMSSNESIEVSTSTHVSTVNSGVQVSSGQQSVSSSPSPVSAQQVPASAPIQPVNQMTNIADIDVGMHHMVIQSTNINTVGVGQIQQGQVLVPLSTTVPQQHQPLPPTPTQLLHNNTSSTTNSELADTEPKVEENEETGRVVVPPKSLPPLNAIKTTALPPSGAIKSNPVKPSSLPLSSANVPTPAVAKKKTEENEVVSPTLSSSPSIPSSTSISSAVAPVPISQSPPILVGSSCVNQPQQSNSTSLQDVPPPGPPQVLPLPPLPACPSQCKQTSSWAGLFKNTSAPVMQPNTAQHSKTLYNSLSTSATPSQNPSEPLQSAKVPCKMSKGPPPQNAVVLTPPPPYLVAPTYSHHHTTSSSATTPFPSSVSPSSTTMTNEAKTPQNKHSSQSHPLANSQDPVLNRIADILAEYELENRAVVLTPRGLNNPSNYCYINATLQALLACAPFYNLIKTLAKIKPVSSSGSSSINNSTNKSLTPVIDSMIQFVSEFSTAPPNRLRRERSEKAQARRDGGGVDQDPGILPGPSFEPSYVYRMVHNSFSVLQHEARQEDAEEFLTGLLNGLNDEMLELLKLKGIGLSNGEVTTNGESHPDIDNSDWKEVMNKGVSRVTRRTEVGRTPLTDIFMGQIRSRVERSDPQLSTDNIQPFFSLHLDVESCDTVEEALTKMTSEKAVEGGNIDEQTTTASYIDHLPLVLIIHLKCFHYSNGRLTKISKSIDFPIDLRPGSKLVQTNKSKQFKGTAYKLFAVVYHDGKEATKGHYLADVYHVGSSCWIRYDDTQVKSVSEQHVLKPKSPRVPYLLLYRRMDKHNRS